MAPIEPLANQIAGVNASLELKESARMIVAAQIDLVRTRQARHQTILNFMNPPIDNEESFNAIDIEINAANRKNAINIGSRLAPLDRYERRALSRRKSAMRDFDLVRRATAPSSVKV